MLDEGVPEMLEINKSQFGQDEGSAVTVAQLHARLTSIRISELITTSGTHAGRRGGLNFIA